MSISPKRAIGLILFVMRDDGDMTEPMNIMLLSALAKRLGYQTALAVLERDDIVETVKRLRPDVVAFSAITGSHQALLEANRRIKDAMPSVKTVIGGPFATFRPQTVNDQPFDALGVGECDDAWPELLDAWAADRSVDAIPNIITPGNSSRVLRRSLTGDKSWIIMPDHLRPRLTALDDLPFLDRDLVYSTTRFRNRYKRTIMASRGCPFRCTYCFEHAWNKMYQGKGKVLQRYSPERLCAELRALKGAWDTRFVKFYDDVFPVFEKDLEWLQRFAEIYPREVGLPFHCLVRAELVAHDGGERLRLLKKAGIASVTMSIESGNAFVRDYVLMRDMSDDDMTRAFATCFQLGIPTFANTILGIPAPVRPPLNAPNYDERVEKILHVARDVNPDRRTAQRGLEERVAEVRASKHLDERDRRFVIDSILREVGVRAKMTDYDEDSIRYNGQRKVSFGEFPTLFPYQGTQLGEYTISQGYFDGDYGKLHASYQTLSPLECYTPEEKAYQQNLALLGTTMMLITGSFSEFWQRFNEPVTELAIKAARLPFTSAFLRLYSAAKNHMHATRVYPMRYSARERVQNFLDNLQLDIFKQVGKDSSTGWRKFFRYRGDRPGQTLGGPPSV